MLKDSLNLRRIILNFPKQFEWGEEAIEGLKINFKFKRLVFCGMGGSALPGELLKLYFEKSKINLPIIIHKDYNLPFPSGKNDFHFVISYSGNTEETISSFKELLKKRLKMIVISSNGKLEKLARKEGIPLILVPKGIPPRFALGYFFSIIFKILKNKGIIKESDKKFYLKLEPEKLEGEGINLAKKIKNRIPLIYSSKINFPLAQIWKINFNENSKVPAFANFFPELNHNEMQGFETFGRKFFIIFLQDKEDYSQIKKRMEITSKILKKKGVRGIILNLKEKDILLKIFKNILISEWTSFYLSQFYNRDPGPVKLVEEFKKKS